MADRRLGREDKKTRRRDYAALLSGINALLWEADPIGLAPGNPSTDEYRPEAEAILSRIDEVRAPRDMERVVHEEFVRFFGLRLAGPHRRFRGVAQRIWMLLSTHEIRSGGKRAQS